MNESNITSLDGTPLRELIERLFGKRVDRETVVALRQLAEEDIARQAEEEAAAAHEQFMAQCASEDAYWADYQGYRRACAEGRAAEFVAANYQQDFDDIPF